MTPQECPNGRLRRRRARDSAGSVATAEGRGKGGGRGRNRSVTRGAAAGVAVFVAKDVLDPDGLVRPLLRGAAERLQSTPSRLLCRAGARYLEFDPHPADVIGPARTVVDEDRPPEAAPAALPVAVDGTAPREAAASREGDRADPPA